MTARDRTIWWLAAAGVIVALIAPLFAVDAPPVLDYPNHLARLYVLAFGATDPALRAMYAPHWGILPNLAIDLVGPPLMHLMPVSVVGRLLLALSALIPVAGVVLYHDAVFRKQSLWSLAVALVAYNALFFLGFMNFLYSVGLAFTAAALWIRLVDWRLGAAVAVAVIANVVLFFCHLLGVLFFVLLVAAHEVVALAAVRASGDAIGHRLVSRGAGLVVALLPVAMLYRFSAMDEATGPTTWDIPVRRLFHLLAPFSTYSIALTLVTAAIVVGALLLILRRLRIDGGSALAFVALGVVYLFAPSHMKSGAVIDVRLPVLMGFLLFAGLQPSLSRQAGIALAATLGVLLIVRVVYVDEVWSDHRRDLADLRATYASVEAGAKVLAVTAGRTESEDYWAAEPSGRKLPFFYRTDEHLPALMLIERHAFWPFLFADPRQQPLVVLPPYRELADPLAEPPQYQLLAEGDSLRFGDHPIRLADFDYVLLLDAGAAEASGPWSDRLQLVHRTDIAALYRVKSD